MIKMNKLILTILCSMMLSCGESNNATGETQQKVTTANLDKLSWVLGNWYMDTPDGIFSEVWVKTNDSLYTGFGIMKTIKGDTAFSEQLKLVANTEGIWYLPTVGDQNNGEEVRFQAQSVTGDDVVFENPQHDFPQKIIYRKLSDSTMLASIEGMQNGKKRREEFSYKRR